MEPYDSVDAYRRRLLGSLHVQSRQKLDEEAGSLQIFVNHECVGIVDCDQATHAVASITQPRPIQTVEIRTASGVLIGSLCAQDLRMKMARLPVGDHVLEISIHNRIDGGSVQVAYQGTQAMLKQPRPLAKETHGHATSASIMPARRRWFLHSAWSGVAMVGRASFAAAVLFLVGDRLIDRFGHTAPPQPVELHVTSLSQKPAVSEKALARQEEVLIKVIQGQEHATRTMQAQEHALARAHQAIDGLTRGQHQLTDRVSRVSQQMARLDEDARAGLEVRGKVDHGVKPAAVTLAQAIAPDMGSSIAGKAPELTTLSSGPFSGIAEAPHELSSLAPFTFWVSFQDNTPEKSIQDLIQEIHGRTGQINAGWYNVEVDLPQPQTPDLFVDSLKKMKIVKSVTMNLKTTSAR